MKATKAELNAIGLFNLSTYPRASRIRYYAQIRDALFALYLELGGKLK